MTYIRNPRIPFVWESDGEYDKPGFKAKNGVIFRTANEADNYDKYCESLRKAEQNLGKRELSIEAEAGAANHGEKGQP